MTYKENNLPPRENNLPPRENNLPSDFKPHIKLIKYSDNQMIGDYIWFWVNDNDEVISDYFESEEEARKLFGLESHEILDINCMENTMNKWDLAHMATAENYAKLSSAKRLKVGAVIVKDNRIISIGYNGMPAGWDNTCEYTIDDAMGYDTGKTKPEVLHAESNAIAKVARSSESSEGATLYTTHAPCMNCAKLIHQAGITRVVWRDAYKTSDGLQFLDDCNIEVDFV